MEEKNIVNKTPHKITLLDEDDNIIRNLPPADEPARLKTKEHIVDRVFEDSNKGVPIKKTDIIGVKNLPKSNENKFYLVSRTLASKLNRDDLLAPNELIRDNEGNVIGCKSLAKIGGE